MKIRVAIFAFTGAMTAFAAGTPPAPLSGIDIQYVDHAVRAQDDFYRYVNGHWLDTTPIPDDRERVSPSSQLDDAIRLQLREIVEEAQRHPDAADPDRQKIATLYAGYLDEATVERLGIRPLRAELARIDVLKSPADVAATIGRLGQYGVRTPIGNAVLNDPDNPRVQALFLYQAGLGMPSRDYYLGEEPRLKQIRAAYVEHVEKLLRLAGDTDAAKHAGALLALETSLAREHWISADAEDPAKTNNRKTVAQLAALAPGLDWRKYLAGAGIRDVPATLIAQQPGFFAGLAKLVNEIPVATWKIYFRYQLLSAYAPYLGHDFATEGFAFESTALRGVPVDKPRWRNGLDLVEQSMGEGLGRLYVAKHFSLDDKARVADMVQNFVLAFDQSLAKLEWMTPQTRQKARDKLARSHAKIGYPDKWRDYGALVVKPGDLVGNVWRARAFEYQRNIAKLGKPVDRDEWFITPQTVDAYEFLPQNEIVLPAGIMHPPFFNALADDAVNYGSIGGTIGHEMCHAFDNLGSQYDGDGVLLAKPGWFTAADQAQFDARTHAFVEQYSAFEPIPGYHVNGEQTLSENIADNCGIAMAYRAWKLSLKGQPSPVIDGLSGDQRFFMGWTQRRRANFRERDVIRILKSDVHAPFSIRGTVPLMNQDAFYEAFGIKPGDKMYAPPEKRVTLW